MQRSNLHLAVACGGAAALLLAGAARTGDMPAMAGMPDMQGHHHEHMLMAGTRTSDVTIALPPVGLVRAGDERTVKLADEIDDGKPVVLDFMYTTCSTVCPLTSQTLAQFQSLLGADRERMHLVSISIDPEQDTPARLREYADRFDAGPGWHHYTGTVAASLTAQRAFDVYRGDKMSHSAVTLLRSAPGQPWRRIDGFVNPDRLLYEYRMLLASR